MTELPARGPGITVDAIRGASLNDINDWLDANRLTMQLGAVLLYRVHAEKLYKHSHATFEAFAKERHGISLSTAKRWVDLGGALWDQMQEGTPLEDLARARAIPSQRAVQQARRGRSQPAPEPAQPSPPAVLDATAQAIPTRTLDIDLPEPATPSSTIPSAPRATTGTAVESLPLPVPTDVARLAVPANPTIPQVLRALAVCSAEEIATAGLVDLRDCANRLNLAVAARMRVNRPSLARDTVTTHFKGGSK